MKIIVALLVSASLMACGGKAKKTTTPDNKTGTTETSTDASGSGSATGGATYGGAKPAGAASDPCGGGAM